MQLSYCPEKLLIFYMKDYQYDSTISEMDSNILDLQTKLK